MLSQEKSKEKSREKLKEKLIIEKCHNREESPFHSLDVYVSSYLYLFGECSYPNTEIQYDRIHCVLLQIILSNLLNG